MRILVIGARGFIGSEIARRLVDAGHHVRRASRDPAAFAANPAFVAMPDADAPPEAWRRLVDGVDHVIHCAGAAHGAATTPRSALMRGNADLTGALAAAAVRGISGRLVYLSSIRALAPASPATTILDGATIPAPVEAYGESKRAAEMRLARAFDGDLRFVVLRPPPVHGPGMKGALGAILRLSALPVPLPFAALTAPNSIVGVGSLAQAAIHALEADNVAGRSFLVADSRAVSVAGMVAAFRRGAGRGPGLFALPDKVLRAGLAIAGQRVAWTRLAGSTIVDAAAFVATGWRPVDDPVPLLEELGRGQISGP